MNYITKATFKSFLEKNAKDLHIKKSADFDGMTDGISWNANAVFTRASIKTSSYPEHDFGIDGIWLTNTRGGDRFSAYDDGFFKGITVNNCCGKFTVAIPLFKNRD